MKSILAGLMSVVTVALAGWQMMGQQPAAVDAVENIPVVELVTSNEDIAGTWSGLPDGLVLEFNADGTTQFGVDSDGSTLGYEAQIWFEGTRMFVTFAGYDGADEACTTATGSYHVQRLENGNLRFADAQDDCQSRVGALQGVADGEFALEYSPVD